MAAEVTVAALTAAGLAAAELAAAGLAAGGSSSSNAASPAETGTAAQPAVAAVATAEATPIVHILGPEHLSGPRRAFCLFFSGIQYICFFLNTAPNTTYVHVFSVYAQLHSVYSHFT